MIASVVAIGIYVVVSLLTCRGEFDMDRMLHRGAYGVPGEHRPAAPALQRWKKRLGISEEFTRGDEFIYFFNVAWTAFWFATFAIGTVAALIWSISEHSWETWWLITVIITAVVGVITIIWFLWGGIRDLCQMLSLLSKEKVDATDDGTVP